MSFRFSISLLITLLAVVGVHTRDVSAAPLSRITPYNAIVVYNSNWDAAENTAMLDSIESTWGVLPYQLGIPTGIQYDDANHPQASHWDIFSLDYDTSSEYGNNTAVSLPAGWHYIQEDFVNYMDGYNLWGTVTHVQLLRGLPCWFRENDGIPYRPYDTYWNQDSTVSWNGEDTTVVRTLSDALWMHAGPNQDGRGTTDFTKLWARRKNNPYATQVSTTGDFSFTSGALYFKPINALTHDSVAAHILKPCLFDGNNLADVLALIGRSSQTILPESGIAAETRWAVFDEADTLANRDYRHPYTGIASFKSNIDQAFPNQVLSDADSISLAAADTLFVCVNDPASLLLQAGDSIAFAFFANSKNNPCPNWSEDLFVNRLIAPVAPGAPCWTPESYFESSRNPALRYSGVPEQALGTEAIHYGFTYTLGNIYEPGSSGLPQSANIAKAITTPNCTFAMLASASTTYGFGTYLAVGSAIGIFRPAAAATETTTVIGECRESISIQCTAPAVADSIRLYIDYSNAADFDSTWNTGPGVHITFARGTKWISGATVSAAYITWIATDSTEHRQDLYP